MVEKNHRNLALKRRDVGHIRDFSLANISIPFEVFTYIISLLPHDTKSISFTHCDLDNSACTFLAGQLSQFSNLQTLNLTGNKIQTEGSTLLFERINSNRLNISWVDLSSNQIKNLPQDILKKIYSRGHIGSIDVGGNPLSLPADFLRAFEDFPGRLFI